MKEYMSSADIQYIREQQEKAKKQITGENERTARRKLMRSWEEEKNTANRCIKPLSEKQLLKQIDHSLSQAVEVRDAEEFEAELDAEMKEKYGASAPAED